MLTETEILQGCINNDRRAQEEFYKKYAPLMLGVLCRYSRTKQEAEDILQEGFVRIFNNISKFKKEVNIIFWMRRIMINSAARYYNINNEKFKVGILKDNLKNKIKDYNDHSSLTSEEILNILQCLPDGYRMIFNMYAIEGYKHKEIAKKLGISVGTSKSQYNRAKKILDKFFNRFENRESLMSY